MKDLRLNLKAKWYDMIESGEKTEEYREIKTYWIKRLFEGYKGQFKHFDTVTFVYGYTKRTMTFECAGIRIGVGNKDWGALDEEVFIIKLGKRL